MIVPYWQSDDGDHVLYCGDSSEIVKELALGIADALITDPPYGIGFKYANHKDASEGYGEWLWPIIEGGERLCKPGSPVFVWQAMPNCREFSKWFPRDWRIFAAAKNFVQLRSIPMEYSYDPVVVWWTEGEKYNRDKTTRGPAGRGCKDFHIADTARVLSQHGNIEKDHPCPRPLDQCVYIVDNFVRPKGLVVDLFAGSGTIAKACMMTGRKSLSIEIDPSYCEIIKRRLMDTDGHKSLFDQNNFEQMLLDREPLSA